jgi:hypothetical protein
MAGAMEKVLFLSELAEEIVKHCDWYQLVSLTKLDCLPVLRDEAYRRIKMKKVGDLHEASLDDLLDYINNVSDTAYGRCHSRIEWRQLEVSDYCRRCHPLLHHESMRQIVKQGNQRLGEALFITFFHTRYHFLKELRLDVLVCRLPFIVNTVARLENLKLLEFVLYLGSAASGKKKAFMPIVPRRGVHYPKVTFSNVRSFVIRWVQKSRRCLLPLVNEDIDDVRAAFPSLAWLQLEQTAVHIPTDRACERYAKSLNIVIVFTTNSYARRCFNHPIRNG